MEGLSSFITRLKPGALALALKQILKAKGTLRKSVGIQSLFEIYGVPATVVTQLAATYVVQGVLYLYHKGVEWVKTLLSSLGLIEDVESYSHEALDILPSMFLSGLTVVIAAVSGFKIPVMPDFSKVAHTFRDWHFAVTGFHTLKTALQQCSALLGYDFRDEDQIELDERLTKVHEHLASTDGVINTLSNDPSAYHQNPQKYKNYLRDIDDYLLWTNDKTLINDVKPYSHTIAKLKDKRKAIFDLIKSIERSCGTKQRPVVIMAVGEPGVGKSLILDTIIKELEKKHGHKLTVCARNEMDQYWSNYTQQDCVKNDDLNSSDDGIGLAELILMASDCAWAVNKAEIDQKGMPFASKYVLIACNTAFPESPKLNNNHAIQRRRDILFRVEDPQGDNMLAAGVVRDTPEWDSHYAKDWSHAIITHLKPDKNDDGGYEIATHIESNGVITVADIANVAYRLQVKREQEFKNSLISMVPQAKQQHLQPMLFLGPPNTGKTSKFESRPGYMDDIAFTAARFDEFTERLHTAYRDSLPLFATANSEPFWLMMKALTQETRAAILRRINIIEVKHSMFMDWWYLNQVRVSEVEAAQALMKDFYVEVEVPDQVADIVDAPHKFIRISTSFQNFMASTERNLFVTDTNLSFTEKLSFLTLYSQVIAVQDLECLTHITRAKLKQQIKTPLHIIFTDQSYALYNDTVGMLVVSKVASQSPPQSKYQGGVDFSHVDIDLHAYDQVSLDIAEKFQFFATIVPDHQYATALRMSSNYVPINDTTVNQMILLCDDYQRHPYGQPMRMLQINNDEIVKGLDYESIMASPMLYFQPPNIPILDTIMEVMGAFVQLYAIKLAFSDEEPQEKVVQEMGAYSDAVRPTRKMDNIKAEKTVKSELARIKEESKTGIKKDHYYSLTRRPAYQDAWRYEGLSQEACADGNFISIMKVITKNIVDLGPCKGLMLRDRLGVTVSHAFQSPTADITINNHPARMVVVKRLASKDLVFFEHNLNAYQNITKHIRSSQDCELLMEGVLVVKKDQVFVCHAVRASNNIDWVDSLSHYGRSYEPLSKTSTVTGFMMTEKGDCGSPYLVFGSNQARKLAGIHCAGGKVSGVLANLVIEDLPSIESQSVEQEAFIPMRRQKVELFVEPEEHPLGTAVGLGVDDNGNPLKCFDTGLTNLWKSPLYHPLCDKYVHEPAILSAYDPRNPERIDPKLKSAIKWNRKRWILEEDTALEAVQEVSHWYAHLLKRQGVKLRKLTRAEAINGEGNNPWSSPINKSTSPGFPWKFSRTYKGMYLTNHGAYYSLDITNQGGKSMMQAINDIILISKCEEVSANVFTCILKDEARPIQKIYDVKTRSIAGCSMDILIPAKEYCDSAVSALMQYKHLHPIKVGINPHNYDWDLLYYYITKVAPMGFDADFSGFDGSIHPFWIESLGRFFNTLYQQLDDNNTDEDDKVRSSLFRSFSRPLIHYDDVIIQLEGGVMSGLPYTSYVDSLINLFAHYYVWLIATKENNRLDLQSIDAFMNYVGLIIFGDDNLSSVHEDITRWWNQPNVARIFKEHLNMDMTAADKESAMGFAKIETMQFLKRRFVKTDLGVLGPLDDDVFAKTMCCTKMRKKHFWSDEINYDPEVIESTIDALMIEAVLKGEQFYADMRKHCEKVATEYNIDMRYFPPYRVMFHKVRHSQIQLETTYEQQSLSSGATNMINHLKTCTKLFQGTLTTTDLIAVMIQVQDVDRARFLQEVGFPQDQEIQICMGLSDSQPGETALLIHQQQTLVIIRDGVEYDSEVEPQFVVVILDEAMKLIVEETSNQRIAALKYKGLYRPEPQFAHIMDIMKGFALAEPGLMMATAICIAISEGDLTWDLYLSEYACRPMQHTNADTDPECVICFNGNGQLECGHGVCKTCIDAWCKARPQTTCPICRKPLVHSIEFEERFSAAMAANGIGFHYKPPELWAAGYKLDYPLYMRLCDADVWISFYDQHYIKPRYDERKQHGALMFQTMPIRVMEGVYTDDPFVTEFSYRKRSNMRLSSAAYKLVYFDLLCAKLHCGDVINFEGTMLFIEARADDYDLAEMFLFLYAYKTNQMDFENLSWLSELPFFLSEETMRANSFSDNALSYNADHVAHIEDNAGHLAFRGLLGENSSPLLHDIFVPDPVEDLPVLGDISDVFDEPDLGILNFDDPPPTPDDSDNEPEPPFHVDVPYNMMHDQYVQEMFDVAEEIIADVQQLEEQLLFPMTQEEIIQDLIDDLEYEAMSQHHNDHAALEEAGQAEAEFEHYHPSELTQEEIDDLTDMA